MKFKKSHYYVNVELCIYLAIYICPVNIGICVCVCVSIYFSIYRHLDYENRQCRKIFVKMIKLLKLQQSHKRNNCSKNPKQHKKNWNSRISAHKKPHQFSLRFDITSNTDGVAVIVVTDYTQ